jgi:hypothetical protein
MGRRKAGVDLAGSDVAFGPRLCENYLHISKVRKQHTELDQFRMSIPFQTPNDYVGGWLREGGADRGR